MSFISVRGLIAAVVVASSLLMVAVAQAEPRVEFDLAMARGVAPTAAQEWLGFFKDLDQSGLRIRQMEADDEPAIDKGGKGESSLYRVVGIITPDNVLLLPGAKFRFGDKRGMAKWIEKVKAGNDPTSTERAGAFGLNAQQLITVHTGLAGKVTFPTKGEPARTIIRRIASLAKFECSFDPAVEKAFQEAEPIPDELNGLTTGTALAAALRPLGLVLRPEAAGGEKVRLLITDARKVEESWPVGWPTEKSNTDLIPTINKFLSVEINDTPASEALAALQQRFDVPFLFDHNGLVRQRIDLEKTNVTVPPGKSAYHRILVKVLYQVKLSWELRVDEAEQPFVWISTRGK